MRQNIEAIASKLIFMETHVSAIRSGEVENNWTNEQWAEYRHLKNTYHHMKRLEQKQKPTKRINYQSIRRYNDFGVI